eukprot:10852368-Karenia_brevis.AAC.1
MSMSFAVLFAKVSDVLFTEIAKREVVKQEPLSPPRSDATASGVANVAGMAGVEEPFGVANVAGMAGVEEPFEGQGKIHAGAYASIADAAALASDDEMQDGDVVERAPSSSSLCEDSH